MNRFFRKMTIKLGFMKKSVLMSLAAILLLSSVSMVMEDKIYASRGVLPRFNYMEGDVEMLRGSKKGEANWRDPLNANPGEEIAVLFYFHNGILNSTATNTNLKVELPTGYAKDHFLKGYLSSEQTTAVTSTVVNGKIVGMAGLTINLSDQGALEYVSGSTKIYINGAQTGTPMPDGIITASGLNIGDIKGCWQYAGYITFLVRIKPVEIKLPSLKMTKTVRNMTLNQTAFVKENAAQAGDILEYKIEYLNSGEGSAKNVVVRDILPANTQYIVDSAIIFDNGSESKLSDSLVGDGITIASIDANKGGHIIFKVRVSQNIAASEVLINTAFIDYGKKTISDTTKTTIVKDSVPANPTTPRSEENLPVSGAENVIIALLLAFNCFVLYNFLIRKKSYLKLLKRAI